MIRMNKWIITGFLLIGLLNCGWAMVYDDFSSSSASSNNWTYSGDNAEIVGRIESGGMEFRSDRTVDVSNVSKLVNFRSTAIFDLTATPEDPLHFSFDLTNFTPKTDDTSYDSLQFGWFDETGDELICILHNNDGTPDAGAIQLKFSGSLFGGTSWFSSNVSWQAGDTLSMEYDGSAVSIVRTRNDSDTVLKTAAFSDASFAGNGKVYLAASLEAYSSERASAYTIDNIITPLPVTDSYVIYQDTFTTDGSLSGRSVETGFGTLWQAHAEMISSSGVARPAATGAAKVAALPFVPEENRVYTLSADMNAISNSWLALGFLSETNISTVSGDGYFYNHVDEQSPWMYTQPNGNVATFTGPTAGGQEVFAGMGSNGTLKVELNTSEANWTATWYFNDTALRTNTYSGSLNITHVAFGGSPISVAEVDNFKLEAVTTLSAYEQWVAGWGVAIGSQNDDYDNDGLDNLCEYGLGGDPTDPADRGITPVSMVEQDGGTNWLTYAYPMLSDAGSGISYHLEVSDDLVSPSWTNAGYLVTGTGTIDADFNAVTNRISTETKPKQFVRLMIEAL